MSQIIAVHGSDTTGVIRYLRSGVWRAHLSDATKSCSRIQIGSYRAQEHGLFSFGSPCNNYYFAFTDGWSFLIDGKALVCPRGSANERVLGCRSF